MSTDKSTAQTHLTTVAIEQTWIIDSFSCYVDTEDEFPELNSAPFSLGHNYPKFRISLWPDGDNQESKKHIALFLHCTAKPSSELPVSFQFSIIDKDGRHRNTEGPLEHTFTKEDSFGWPYFIAHTKLLDPKNGLLFGDQLKIHCKVKASFKKSTSGLSYRLYDRLAKLSLKLEKVFDNDDLCDVIFCVDGIDIPAHKIILNASSSVFARMFAHKGTKEANEGKVVIEDVDVDTFYVLLEFLYIGQIPDQAQLTEELLAASDKYLVYDLKNACEEHLSTTLTIDSATTMFLFADTHSASTLKVNCLHYILANATKVMATEGWKEMLKTRPELVDEICRHLALKTDKQWKQLNEFYEYLSILPVLPV